MPTPAEILNQTLGACADADQPTEGAKLIATAVMQAAGRHVIKNRGDFAVSRFDLASKVWETMVDRATE